MPLANKHPGETFLAYPSAPWHLQGHAICSSYLLDIPRVMAPFPPELSVVPVLPGKTLGGIYLAVYEAGSVLEYHELIAVSALVRYRRKLGAWVSHIYVDNSYSVAGGREIWGLPKQLAEFTWDDPLGPAFVRQGERLLCTLRAYSSAPPRTTANLSPRVRAEAQGTTMV
ncbi:MAG: FIG00570072: hypothetical protein [uncultured Chloroflexia bacterium]|uniref:Acetoacetate decarboxylase n=1 Tax=uncultured Chloroflexia bacterium TaxID=1672391 RepID=A0A6J4HLQ3_9CHLR|nr:MAG: FIG00570072: hypothetical protein [uncultured Chloroflexia bacterium]